MLHPRQLVAGLRRIDRVRVDALVGLLLLVVIELQVWLTPSVSHRLLHTLLGLVFALAVAVRRRRPLSWCW
jgi:hypothetical protein